MRPVVNLLSRFASRFPVRARTRSYSRRLWLEEFEDRAVPAALSVGDGTAVEGEGLMKFIDAFVPAGSGGLIWARGLDYGPDGNIYVSGDLGASNPDRRGFVNRYDAATGAFIDCFASDPTMIGAKDVEFGPDGN